MGQLIVNPHSSSGHILSQDAVWATSRGAATGDSTGDAAYMGGELSATYDIYRYFLKFDTSSLPDTAIITSATLELYFVARDTTNDFTIATQTHTAPNETLATADFDALTVDTPTEFSDRSANVSTLTLNVYTSFTLNAAGLAAISKTGYTLIAVRSSKDVDNATPTGRSYVQAQSDTEANPPKLTINYSLDAGNFFALL